MGRIAGISRVVADLDRAAGFYRDALGFRVLARGPADPAALRALGQGSGEQIELALGMERVSLVRFAAPGRPYPPDSLSNDLWFQHLAIVVDDMDAAYAHLCAVPGWRSISQGAPLLLPPASGGVRAFKFRDPDGHPLEVLWFPPGAGRPVWHGPTPHPPFRGIDHSALAISTTPGSLRFYRTLGFHRAYRSLNRGPAQDALDGLGDARVRITGLRLAGEAGPGLELLRYRQPGRRWPGRRPNDVATDWVTLAVSGGAARAVRDPDGHLLLLTGHGRDAPASGPAT